MTSSYSSTRLRMRKFCSSTFRWAFSICLDSIPGERLVVVGVAGLQAEFDQLELGEVVRVAAELDVDAAACHVRGDGHGAGATGLRDGVALALGVLGFGV